jgi:type II secretory pathway pseudopilin PulG
LLADLLEIDPKEVVTKIVNYRQLQTTTRRVKMKQSNQKGFSLISVLIGIAIFGMLSMAMVDLSLLMIKNNITAQANSDILAYVNQLRVNLQDQDNSTKMLKGNDVTGQLIMVDPYKPTDVLAGAGHKQESKDAWQVKSVFSETPVGTSILNLYRLRIQSIMEKDKDRVLGPAIAKRLVADVYCTVIDNIIQSCNGGSDLLSGLKVGCEVSGGIWNSILGKCEFKPVANPTPPPTPKDDNDKDDKDHEVKPTPTPRPGCGTKKPEDGK